MVSRRWAFLVLTVGFLRLLGPGSGKVRILAYLQTVASAALRQA